MWERANRESTKKDIFYCRLLTKKLLTIDKTIWASWLICFSNYVSDLAVIRLGLLVVVKVGRDWGSGDLKPLGSTLKSRPLRSTPKFESQNSNPIKSAKFIFFLIFLKRYFWISGCLTFGYSKTQGIMNS